MRPGHDLGNGWSVEHVSEHLGLGVLLARSEVGYDRLDQRFRPEKFATWLYRAGDDESTKFQGHYHFDRTTALADYDARVARLRADAQEAG